MGDIKYYKHISVLITVSFLVNITILLIMNISSYSLFLEGLLGIKKTFVIELFFWAALGATIACSLFLSEDKEMNEVESVKENPDPKILRYPDEIDVIQYLHRIITSGILGVIGALMLFSGLFFFEANLEILSIKHRMFFVILCFLIGLYQRNFIAYLGDMFRKILEKQNK